MGGSGGAPAQIPISPFFTNLFVSGVATIGSLIVSGVSAFASVVCSTLSCTALACSGSATAGQLSVSFNTATTTLNTTGEATVASLTSPGPVTFTGSGASASNITEVLTGYLTADGAQITLAPSNPMAHPPDPVYDGLIIDFDPSGSSFYSRMTVTRAAGTTNLFEFCVFDYATRSVLYAVTAGGDLTFEVPVSFTFINLTGLTASYGTIGTLSATILGLTSDLNMGGDLTVDGYASLGVVTCDTLTVSSTSSLEAVTCTTLSGTNISGSGNLTITGNTVLGGTVNTGILTSSILNCTGVIGGGNTCVVHSSSGTIGAPYQVAGTGSYTLDLTCIGGEQQNPNGGAFTITSAATSVGGHAFSAPGSFLVIVDMTFVISRTGSAVASNYGFIEYWLSPNSNSTVTYGSTESIVVHIPFTGATSTLTITNQATFYIAPSDILAHIIAYLNVTIDLVGSPGSVVIPATTGAICRTIRVG
jgi:hypothetical protein